MITAKSGQEHYLTQLSKGTASICSDLPRDRGGSGEYLKPHDLLCAGFASCLNITLRMVLERMNVAYDQVVTKVDLSADKENATTFLYHIEIVGDIDAAVKEAAIAKALNCPVRKTLSKDISFQPL